MSTEAERIRALEVQNENMQAQVIVLFRKIDELPDRIARVVDDRMRVHEERESEITDSIHDSIKTLQTENSVIAADVAEINSWRSKVTGYFMAIAAVAAFVASILKDIILKIIHAIT